MKTRAMIYHPPTGGRFPMEGDFVWDQDTVLVFGRQEDFDFDCKHEGVRYLPTLMKMFIVPGWFPPIDEGDIYELHAGGEFLGGRKVVKVTYITPDHPEIYAPGSRAVNIHLEQDTDEALVAMIALPKSLIVGNN